MNKYLEKIAVTRLVNELALGNVRTTLRTLNNKGFLRSVKTYAKGLQKGVNAVVREAKADITRVKDLDSYQGRGVINSGGYATSVSKDGGIHIVHDNGIHNTTHLGPSKRQKELAHQAGLMHEAYEAKSIRKDLNNKVLDTGAADSERSYFKKLQSKTKEQEKKLNASRRFLDQVASPVSKGLVYQNGIPKGHHQSLAVLGREANMVRSNPYLQRSEYPTARMDSGEAQYLYRITGKRYGMDRFTSTDLKKLDTAKPSRIVNGNHVHDV